MQSSQCAEWSVLPILKTFVQDPVWGVCLGPGGGAWEALEGEQVGPGQRTPGLGGMGPGCGFQHMGLERRAVGSEICWKMTLACAENTRKLALEAESQFRDGCWGRRGE